MYKIIKGLPASFAVFIKNDGEYIDLHDGWDVDISLRLNTTDGTPVSGLDISDSGNGFIVALTSEQTSTLDHRSVSYMLVVKASTTDQLTNLRSVVKVIVENDI
jgi:hypothetical protein